MSFSLQKSWSQEQWKRGQQEDWRSGPTSWKCGSNEHFSDQALSFSLLIRQVLDCVFYDENKLRTAAATTTAHDDDLSEASSFHCAASSYQYYQWRKGCGRGGGKIHHVKSPQTFPVTESFYYDSDDDRPFLSDLMDVVVDDADDDQTYNNVLNHVTLFETI